MPVVAVGIVVAKVVMPLLLMMMIGFGFGLIELADFGLSGFDCCVCLSVFFFFCRVAVADIGGRWLICGVAGGCGLWQLICHVGC